MIIPTQLTLYNQALRLLGEPKLATLEDARPERRVLDTVWEEDPIRQILEKTYWSFATRTLEWNFDPSLEPPFGYRRVFTKPPNYIRTVAICSDEFFTAPLLRYSDENNFWYCELDTIYIKYVSDSDLFGRDYSLWTSLFKNCVASFMATQAATGITKSASIHKEVKDDYKDHLKSAKSLDAQNKPTTFMPAGRWTRSRRGSGVYRGDGTR